MMNEIIPRICATLETQYVRVMMMNADQSSALVNSEFGIFILCDNGGEINVCKVNAWDRPVSIPLDWFGKPLSMYTMTYRILRALAGKEIDWKLRIKDPEPLSSKWLWVA